MRYCPECKAEYRDGFDTCFDCQVPLVDELTSEISAKAPLVEGVIERIKMKDLVVMADLANIALLKVVLKENNIEFYAMQRSSMYGAGGVLFKVDETQYYDALQLLDEINQPIAEDDDNMEIEE